jgi:hypothetical protein
MRKKLLPFLIVAIIATIMNLLFDDPAETDLQTTTAKKSHPKKTLTVLWQGMSQTQSEKVSDPLADNIEVASIQAEPSQLARLSEGQSVSFFIPQNQRQYQGVVESHYQQFDGKVSVSKGRLLEGDELSSFMVTRGPDTTVVMVATDDGVYQIEIDNSTGQGTVIDDRALDYFRKHNDSILTPQEGLS